MKLLFQVLLLVVMFALQKSQEEEEIDLLEDSSWVYGDVYEPEYYSVENVTVPNITVYRQMEDGEQDRVIVVCVFDRMFEWGNGPWMDPFELSVESELNYTKEKVTSFPFSERSVYMVTVSPPASFTCEHEFHSNGDVKNLRSQTYTYKRSVLDHHEEGVSLLYICFSSFIAVGLVIMTVAVIVTTIRSKSKDSFINPTTTVTDNDYMDA